MRPFGQVLRRIPIDAPFAQGGYAKACAPPQDLSPQATYLLMIKGHSSAPGRIARIERRATGKPTLAQARMDAICTDQQVAGNLRAAGKMSRDRLAIHFTMGKALVKIKRAAIGIG